MAQHSTKQRTTSNNGNNMDLHLQQVHVPTAHHHGHTGTIPGTTPPTARQHRTYTNVHHAPHTHSPHRTDTKPTTR
eukprot:12527637-Prorocentrum_lima.AAC.1